MADYVILEGSLRNNQVRGYGYSAVPNQNNDANLSWRTALVEYLTEKNGTTLAKSPRLPGAVTQAQLTAGAVVEWDFDVGFNAHDLPAAKVGAVEAAIASRETEVIAELMNKLRFWGREGSV